MAICQPRSELRVAKRRPGYKSVFVKVHGRSSSTTNNNCYASDPADLSANLFNYSRSSPVHCSLINPWSYIFYPFPKLGSILYTCFQKSPHSRPFPTFDVTSETLNCQGTAPKERQFVSPAKVSFGAQTTMDTQGWVRNGNCLSPRSLIEAIGQIRNDASDPADLSAEVL